MGLMRVAGSSVRGEREPASDRAVKFMLWVTFGIVTVQAVLLIVEQVQLYGDGSAYLYWLLRSRRPLAFAANRRFANLVTEIPVVFALRAGLTDVGVASRLFGAGVYLPLIVSLGLCIWLARERLELMLFPLLSAVAVTSNTDFLIISESNVLVALFWPLLFLFTLRREWSGWTFALAFLLAGPTLLCYESMVFIGPILVALAVWRAAEMRRACDAMRARRFLFFAFYFAMGILVGAWWIMHPRDERNFRLFLQATRFYQDGLGHVHWLGILSFVGLLLTAAALLFRRWPKIVGWVLIAAFAVACAFAALAPAMWPSSFAPKLHARARVLNAYLAPLLGIAYLLAWRRPLRPERLRHAFAIVAILAAAQLVWHAGAARRWTQYLDAFRAEVATKHGIVPHQETVLSRQPYNVIFTSWALPVMSILMAPDGRVQAMIQSPNPTEWQPVYPEKIESLPDLSRYGFSFDEYKSAVENQRRQEIPGGGRPGS